MLRLKSKSNLAPREGCDSPYSSTRRTCWGLSSQKRFVAKVDQRKLAGLQNRAPGTSTLMENNRDWPEPQFWIGSQVSLYPGRPEWPRHLRTWRLSEIRHLDNWRQWTKKERSLQARISQSVRYEGQLRTSRSLGILDVYVDTTPSHKYSDLSRKVYCSERSVRDMNRLHWAQKSKMLMKGEHWMNVILLSYLLLVAYCWYQHVALEGGLNGRMIMGCFHVW